MTVDVEQRLQPLLDRAELRRSERFKFDWLRRRFTVSHAMVRVVLGELLGVDPAGLRFEPGPHGKPSVVGGGVEFNLSHSADRALLAVGRAGPVGIDIEQIRWLSHVEQVAERILSPTELDGFRRAADPNLFVLSAWTCKEAVVKQSGDGITRSLRDVDGSVCLSLDVGAGFLASLAADGVDSAVVQTWSPP